MDQLIQNLSFEAVAVPQDDVLQLYTANTTPIKIKIKMKKGWKNNMGIQQRVFSSTRPRKRYTNGYSKKIRMVQSDQTIMSFNMLMKPDSTSKIRRKSHNKFFHLFKTGKCLGPQDEDEDDPPYLPATINKYNGVETKRRTTGSDNTQHQIRTLEDKTDIQHSKKITKTPTFFLGKCKAGGCLDPPFSEDKYQYEPSLKSKPSLNLKEKEDVDFKQASCDSKNIHEKITEHFKKEIKVLDQDKTDTSTLMLYKAGSENKNVDGKCSLSIVTYPPETSSEDLSVQDKISLSNKRPTVRSKQLIDDTIRLRKSEDKTNYFNNKDKNKYNRYILKADRNRTSSLLLDKNDIIIKENVVSKPPETISQPEYKLLELVQVSENSSLNENQISKPLFASFPHKHDATKIKSEIDIKEAYNYCSTSNEALISKTVKVEGDKTSIINIKNISSHGADHEFDINKIQNGHIHHESSQYSKYTKRPSYEGKKDLKLNSFRKKNDEIIANGLAYSDHNVMKKGEHSPEMTIKDKQRLRNTNSVQEKSKNELTINSNLLDANKNISKISKEVRTRENKLPSYDLNVIQNIEKIVIAKKYNDHNSVISLPKQDEHLGENHREVLDILDTNKKSDDILESYDSHSEEDRLKESENTISAIQPEYYNNNMTEKTIPPDSENYTAFFNNYKSDDITNKKLKVHKAQDNMYTLEEKKNSISAILTESQHGLTIKPYETEYNTQSTEPRSCDSNIVKRSKNIPNSKNNDEHKFDSNSPKSDKNLDEYHTEISDILNNDQKNYKNLESHEGHSENDRSIKNESTITARQHEKVFPPGNKHDTEVLDPLINNKISDTKIKYHEPQNDTYSSEENENIINAVKTEDYKGNLLDKTILFDKNTLGEYSNISDTENGGENGSKKYELYESNNADSLDKNKNTFVTIQSENLSNFSDTMRLSEYSKENQILDTQNVLTEHPSARGVVNLSTPRVQGFTHNKTTTQRNSNNLPLINIISLESDSMIAEKTVSNISSLKDVTLLESKGVTSSGIKLFKSDEIIPRDDIKIGAHTIITKQDTDSISKSNHILESSSSELPRKNLAPFSTEDTVPKIFVIKDTPSPTIEVKDIKTEYIINKSGSESLKQSKSESMQNYEFSKSYQNSVLGGNVEYAKTSENQLFDEILPIMNENTSNYSSATKEYSEPNDDIDVPHNISERSYKTRSNHLYSDLNSNKPVLSTVVSENTAKVFDGHFSTNTKVKILTAGLLSDFQRSVCNIQYDEKIINASNEIKNIKINKESKEHWVNGDKQKKSNVSLGNDTRTTIVHLGFQTYVNEDNEIILRTFNASKEPQRLPEDNIVVIKSALTLNDSKLSFCVNSDTKISIQIKRNNKPTNPEEKIDEIKGYSSDEIIHCINKGSKIQIDLCDIGTLQKSLSAIYENDLVPVEKLIKTLRLEIDKIVKYRLLVKNKSMVTKKIKQICSYKRCGCLRKN